MPDQNNNKKSGSKESSAEKTADEKSMKHLVDIREQLGVGLRSMYRSVLEEPLPADMMALLDQLDENEEVEKNPNSSKSSPDQRD